MTRIMLIILIVSIFAVAYLWLPAFLNGHKKVKDIDKDILLKSAAPRMSEVGGAMETVEAVKEEPEKSKTDWRVIITWIIGSANGVLLILSQIQKIFGPK